MSATTRLRLKGAGIALAQLHRAYGDALDAALSALVKYDLNLPHIGGLGEIGVGDAQHWLGDKHQPITQGTVSMVCLEVRSYTSEVLAWGRGSPECTVMTGYATVWGRFQAQI